MPWAEHAAAGPMNWKHRYHVASYVKSSLWIVPFGALVLQPFVGRAVHSLDLRLGWTGLGFGMNGAKAIIDTVITLSLSFIVFTFGSLLVAIQVASGQYTPRVIATTLLRDNVIRYTVALFVFTLVFTVRAINRLEANVAQLFLCMVALLGLICLAAFLFLIDYAARLLRPVSLVKRVGDDGLRVIDSVYPERAASEPVTTMAPEGFGPVERTILHRG